MEPHGSGTDYTAVAVHRDETGKNTHEQIGFHQGWGTALDQLVKDVASLYDPPPSSLRSHGGRRRFVHALALLRAPPASAPHPRLACRAVAPLPPADIRPLDDPADYAAAGRSFRTLRGPFLPNSARSR